MFFSEFAKDFIRYQGFWDSEENSSIGALKANQAASKVLIEGPYWRRYGPPHYSCLGPLGALEGWSAQPALGSLPRQVSRISVIPKVQAVLVRQ